MELIHIHCERDISKLEKQIKSSLSLENLASKQKLSRLLKSKRCARQRLLTTRQIARSRQHM
jgi:hypothetical protein